MSDWPRHPLESACLSITDGDWVETKDQGGSDYRLLQVSNIGLGSFRETGNFRYVSHATFDRLRCTAVKRGHVLVSRMPDPVGRAWHVRELPFPAITAVDIAIIDPDPSRLDGAYLGYYLNSPQNLAYVAARATGTTRVRITRRDLAQFKVPLPPLPTQRKIAAVLAAYDDLIEINNRRINFLEEMAQRLYREWFVDFRFPGHQNVPLVDSESGPIPRGWELATLGTVAENFDRQRKPLSSMVRALRPGLYPYYGAAKIFDYIDDYIFDGTYLLLAEDGSVITPDGKPVLQYVTGKFWANNHTHILRGTRVSTEFLSLLLADTPISGYITGAAQPKITQANMNRIPCIVPAQNVAEIFDQMVIPIFGLVDVLTSLNRNLRATRDLLLPRLIAGEVDVADLDIAMAEDAA